MQLPSGTWVFPPERFDIKKYGHLLLQHVVICVIICERPSVFKQSLCPNSLRQTETKTKPLQVLNYMTTETNFTKHSVSVTSK